MKKGSDLPVSDYIAAELRKAIFTNEYQHGEELVQETLAHKYNVSRIPIRQALQLLANEGLVILRKNRSALVNQLNYTDIEEHFKLRGLLEGEAAALAAERGENFADIIEADRLTNESKERQDLEAFKEYNFRFHEAIWDAARSPRLKGLIMQVWNNISLVIRETPEVRMNVSCAEHNIILNSILLRNPDLARKAMHDHIVIHNLENFKGKT